MFWIYLSIFVLVVLVPELIVREWYLLPEEELESLLILVLGGIGIMVYLAKEKELFGVVAEKKSFQKQVFHARRGLSESYSYIGAMNRKYDIVYDLACELPTYVALEKLEDRMKPILETILLIARTKAATLVFFDTKQSQPLEHICEGDDGLCRTLAGICEKHRLDADRVVLETDGAFVVRSPSAVNDVTVCIVLPKSAHELSEVETLQHLASLALLLYLPRRTSI